MLSVFVTVAPLVDGAFFFDLGAAGDESAKMSSGNKSHYLNV